jgi:acetyl-CoA hydrolase
MSRNSGAPPRELTPETLDFTAIARPGDAVLWGQAGAEPVTLTRVLIAQSGAIPGLRAFLGIGLPGAAAAEAVEAPIAFSGYSGAGYRALAKAGKLDILPAHYSALPRLIREGRLSVDLLLLQLAPTEEPGRYSFSVAEEYLAAALERARIVVAEINDQAPMTYGSRTIAAEELDVIVRSSRPPLAMSHAEPNDIERAIAGHIAALVPDGATLQFGVGAVPEAVLANLGNHRDLGIHSGSIGDAGARLMETGVVTNRKKAIDPGATIACILLGSRVLYDFAHRNPAIRLRASDYTHNAAVLARLERFVAINSAVEVDLSGQIGAEVAGGAYVGAVGGAVDFLRGAAASKGGLPIIALPSMAGSRSRIVARLDGAVSTPRSDAAIIVTEYGVADLRGLPLSERARRLVAIAHPDAREALEREAFGIPGLRR